MILSGRRELSLYASLEPSPQIKHFFIQSEINKLEDEEWIYFIGKHPEEELPGAKWIDTPNGPRLVLPRKKSSNDTSTKEKK